MKNFANYTFPCDFDFFPKKLIVFSSAKISDDHFLVIDSTFLNFAYNLDNYLTFSYCPPSSSLNSKHVHFPQKRHPIFHVLNFSLPLKCNTNFLPPKKWPPKYFPLKIAMMKISASFPIGMDAPGPIYVYYIAY